MNTRKSKLLLTTAVLFAGVSLASAQGMRETGSSGMSAGGEASGGAAEHGRSGGEMSHGANGGAHSKGMTQDRTGGRAEGSSAARESGRAAGKSGETIGQGRGDRDSARQSQSEHEMPGNDQTVGRSHSDRDQTRQSRSDSDKSGGKNQTIGQGRSDRDSARQSHPGYKKHGKDQTIGQSQSERGNARQSSSDSVKSGQKDQTVGQSRGDRTRRSQGAEQNKSATTGANTKDSGQGKDAQDQSTTTGANTKSSARGQSAQQNQGTNTQGQPSTQAQAQGGTTQSMSGRVQVNAQQQTKLQQSVLNSRKVERVRVNDNAVNFRINTGVVVPRNISVISVSEYPALIDVYPAYRDDSFFVVDDEIVVTDRSRRIVDVIPAGPRTHYAHRGSSSVSGGSMAALDLSPDDIRIVQRVLIERGLLSGEADGILGPDTRAALISFQKEEGFQTTGSIDTRTVAALGVSNQISATRGQSTTVGQGRNSGSTQQNTTTQNSGQTNAPAQHNQTTGQAGQNQPSRTGQAQQNQPTTSGHAGTKQPSGQTTGQAPTKDSVTGTHQNTRSGQTNQNDAPPPSTSAQPSTSGQPGQKQPSH